MQLIELRNITMFPATLSIMREEREQEKDWVGTGVMSTANLEITKSKFVNEMHIYSDFDT